MIRFLSFLTLITFSLAGNLFAQVIVTQPIIMTGSSDSLRKVSGIGGASELSDAVNYKDYYSGKLRFATPTGFSNNSWNLTVSMSILSYTEGMMIYFIADTNNTGPATININNLGAVSLNRIAGFPLDTNDLVKDLPVLAIYDGSAFQLISDVSKKCPATFIRVNEHYCIQPVENDSAYFWPAAKYCGDLNAKLCTWGQWYYACQKTGLGITDMTNNWEWVDVGGNLLTWTTPPAANTGSMVGENGCSNVQTAIADPTHTHSRAFPKTYRCCYEF